jgi:hypothetical protein
MSKKIPPDLQVWIEARNRYRLSHAQVQMARELGMNPKKLGSLNNHKQEPWKLPLVEFIEELYLKRFGKPAPDEVVTIEEKAKRLAAKKAANKKAREASRQQRSAQMGASAEAVEIFIPLLYEGTDVLRPTQGIALRSDEVQVVATPDYDPTVEEWEFPPGSKVRCEEENQGGRVLLVARERIV